MSRPEATILKGAGRPGSTIFYRFIRLFTIIHPGEIAKASLLFLNSFLIMFGYYQIKPVREGLLLAAHPATLKSYLAIPQAFILIFVIKAFAKVASRYPRHILITWVTLFCISNLILFNILNWAGVSVAVMGISSPKVASMVTITPSAILLTRISCWSCETVDRSTPLWAMACQMLPITWARSLSIDMDASLSMVGNQDEIVVTKNVIQN